MQNKREIEHREATTNRVVEQQETVKEKAQQTWQAAQMIWQGEKELPTTEEVGEVLKRGEKALQSVQSGETGQQLGEKQQMVLEDMQRVLDDELSLLQKNEGDLIQNIVRHGWTLVQDLRGDPSFQVIFDNWHRLMDSIVSGGDIKGLLSSGGELMKSLRETEEFLDLVAELIGILRTVIAEKTEQVVDGDSNVRYKHQAEKDAERGRLIANLRAVLSALSNNYIWCDMVHRGRMLAERGKHAGGATKEAAQDVLDKAFQTENAQCMAEDIRVLLQRLAGDVDVDPLFDYSKAAWEDIIHNEDLSSILYQLENTMKHVSQNPEIANDPIVQQTLRDITSRAETVLNDLKDDPNIICAKEESKKVVAAIKNDPTNRQLINDMKRLWNDVKSDEPGELIDPALLSGLKQIAIPMLIEHLQNVPIPPIHDTIEFLGTYSYTIDNIRVSVPDLIPEDIHLRIECDLDAEPLKLEVHNKRTFVFLEIRDIQIHLHDVAWSYTRTSTPHLHDAGHVDIDTKGHGVGIKMKLEIKRNMSDNQVLDVLAVRTSIDKWEVKVTDSKHDFVYKTLAHMFGNKIKREIQKTIEEKLRKFGTVANEQLITLLHELQTKSQEASGKLGSIKESVKESVKENAKGVKDTVLKHAQDDGVPEINVTSAKDDILSFVSEKATELLSRQQEKIDAKREKITLGHQRERETETLAPTGRSTLSDSSFLRIARDPPLGASSSIPPTPPPSPISNLSDGMPLLDSCSSIPTAEEEYCTTPLLPPSPLPPSPCGWAQPPPPSIGYEVYPDLPSFSSSPARSTDSDIGSDVESISEKLESLAAARHQSRVNEQGTSQL